MNERDAFELKFPTPPHCIKVGDSYAATEYSAWGAHDHIQRRVGWLAALEWKAVQQPRKEEPYGHVDGETCVGPCIHCDPVDFKPDTDQIIEALLDYIDQNTCMHLNTHRGGTIWEICDDCHEKWADDRGGKPEFKWPDCVEAARGYLTWLGEQ